MLVHVVQRDVFPVKAVGTSLEGNKVIPDRRRDEQLMPQLAIFFIAAVQTILVGFTHFNYDWHCSNPSLVGELVGIAVPRPTPLYYYFCSTESIPPYIPMPKGSGFTALFDKFINGQTYIVDDLF